MRGVVFVVALTCCFSACKGKSTPSCEDAIKTASKKVPRLADPNEMSETIAACIRDQWSAEMRNCVASSRDEPDFLACILRHAPRTGRRSTESKVETTKIKVRKLAHEAYPTWAAAHQDKPCPDMLADLSSYVGDQAGDVNDSWNHPLKMTCGPTNPPGVKGLGVFSFGEDGRENTDDDIKSWE